MKIKTTFKSLADLPANALAIATSVPSHAVNLSRQVLEPGMRATRREIRLARRRSAEFTASIYARMNAPLRAITPWSRNGLNE